MSLFKNVFPPIPAPKKIETAVDLDRVARLQEQLKKILENREDMSLPDDYTVAGDENDG